MSENKGWTVPIRRIAAGVLGAFHIGIFIVTTRSFMAEPTTARFCARAWVTASILLGLSCAVMFFATLCLTGKSPSWMPGRRKPPHVPGQTSS